MKEKIRPHIYLNGVASSRQLYSLLFWEAVGVLPPPGCSSEFETLRCGLSQREMAKRLGMSPSTVGEDLRRLVLYGWVRSGKERYTLGSRRGNEYFLHADVAAMESTGEKHLVSESVLLLRRIKPADKDRVGRGIDRQWQAD